MVGPGPPRCETWLRTPGYEIVCMPGPDRVIWFRVPIRGIWLQGPTGDVWVWGLIGNTWVLGTGWNVYFRGLGRVTDRLGTSESEYRMGSWSSRGHLDHKPNREYLCYVQGPGGNIWIWDSSVGTWVSCQGKVTYSRGSSSVFGSWVQTGKRLGSWSGRTNSWDHRSDGCLVYRKGLRDLSDWSLTWRVCFGQPVLTLFKDEEVSCLWLCTGIPGSC